MSSPWTLLFHQCVIAQLDRLTAAADRARASNPKTAHENANVKLHAALAKLILETVPSDPARDEFRQGNTMGPEFRHWRRAKIGRRFRLFFRYDSRSKVIVYSLAVGRARGRVLDFGRVASQPRQASQIARGMVLCAVR